MLKQIIIIIMGLTLVISVNAQINQPTASISNLAEAEATTPPDGRTVKRFNGNMVGLIRVEWPKGALTTPHNHANELIIAVDSGRIKAFSGGKEYMLEAGDVITIPSWVDHGFEALEDSVTYEAAGPG